MKLSPRVYSTALPAVCRMEPNRSKGKKVSNARNPSTFGLPNGIDGRAESEIRFRMKTTVTGHRPLFTIVKTENDAMNALLEYHISSTYCYSSTSCLFHYPYRLRDNCMKHNEISATGLF